MKTKILIALFLGMALTPGAMAALTNSWDSTSGGKWEGSHWSLGVPPGSTQSEVFISNGFVFPALSKTVTADFTTASSPGTMTISNLTLSAATTHQNILIVTNTGAVALKVTSSLTISNGGVLRVFSSPLQVPGQFVFPVYLGSFFDDGSLTLNGSGALGVITVGSIPFIVGHNSTGAYLQNSGTLSAVSLIVGYNSGAQGTMTLAGGLTTLSSDLTLGSSAGSIGTVTVSGGGLIVTNGNVVIGNAGVGQCAMSGGIAMLGSNVVVGNLAGSAGTLSVSAGQLTAFNDLLIGNSDGATGTVWLTGGELGMAPCASGIGFSALTCGFSGVGRMTVSNGTASSCGLAIGQYAGSQGTLTIAGGLMTADGCVIGEVAGSTGTVWVTGGQLVVTNAQTIIGDFGVGQMIMSNGSASMFNACLGRAGVNAQGTLTVGGGIVTNQAYLRIVQGSVWVTGGQLVMADCPYVPVGACGGPDNLLEVDHGSTMTVSNGNVQAPAIVIYPGSQLTMAGGSINFQPTLRVDPPSLRIAGTALFAGGQTIITNGLVDISQFASYAAMIVTNGTILSQAIRVGHGANEAGSFTLSGGTVLLSSNLDLGDLAMSTGMVWVTGGQLVVTNAPTIIGNSGVGQMTLSNGTFLARDVIVGKNPGSQGSLIVPGGSWTVQSSLVMGDCATSASGIVTVSGGSLYVTNSTGTAVLDVRNGQLILNGGLLKVDKLVMTNSCGLIIHNNGTLIMNSLPLLDPNLDADSDGLPNGWEQSHGLDPLNANGNDGANADPDGDGFNNLQEYLAGTDPHNSGSALRIISVVPQGNNIQVTWTTAGGKTNAVQATNGTGGSYATNFTDLITIPIGGSGDVTNTYIDPGGATNKPARFYRIRLVP